MASFRKRGRIWYYRCIDADGVKRERKGCSDRRATEDMAREAEAEAARARAGLIDPRAEARRRQAARPLSDHLAEWRAHLIASGHAEKHAGLSLDRVRRMAAIVAGAPLADAAPPDQASRARADRPADRRSAVRRPPG